MKYILLGCFGLITFTQCKKTATTNNYITTEHYAAWTVEGLRNITLSAGSSRVSLPISVNYYDSAQQKVKLSVGNLPAGITLSVDGPMSGYPSFGTTLYFYDTSSTAPSALGEYSAVLTAEGEKTGTKQFTFKITVTKPASCADKYAGIFNFCRVNWISGNYSDTISLDPVIINKVWLSNFANKGRKVYAFYNCDNAEFIVPDQVVGGMKFSGSGNGINTGYGGYMLGFNISIDSVSGYIYIN